jgi:hypothetical protein
MSVSPKPRCVVLLERRFELGMTSGYQKSRAVRELRIWPAGRYCYGGAMDRDALARFMRFEHRTFRWNDGEDHSRYEAVESTDGGCVGTAGRITPSSKTGA